MVMYSFAGEAMVGGYHVYYFIWDVTTNGEDSECFKEMGNVHDLSAVAIQKHYSWTCPMSFSITKH